MTEDNAKSKTKLTVTVKKIFWIAIAILLFLLILTIIILSARLYDYIKIDEREVMLKTNMDTSFDVFSVTYKNASGEVTVEGMDGEKVVAPGTHVEYTVRLRNKDKVAIDYNIIPDVKFESEHKLPILVRLIGPDEEYLAGDAKTWIPVEELEHMEDFRTLGKNETNEYIFQWKWPFESGDDFYDTFLGNIAVTENIGITVSFEIYSESNTSMADNGGFFGSGAHDIMLWFILFLLLLIAIIILIISIFKRQEIKAEQAYVAATSVPAPEPEPIIPIIVPEPEPEPIIPIVVPEPEPIVVPIPVTPEIKKLKFHGKMEYINIDEFEPIFNSGDVITLAILKEKGLIAPATKQMKILARNGKLLKKAFTVETQGISAEARRCIKEAGGTVIIAHGDKK